MTKLARWMARLSWYGMLWVMRRPWMKRLQRQSLKLFPERKRSKAQQSLVEQNRLARRIGLRLLTIAYSVFLASVLVTGTYYLALYLVAVGVPGLPEAAREALNR